MDRLEIPSGGTRLSARRPGNPKKTDNQTAHPSRERQRLKEVTTFGSQVNCDVSTPSFVVNVGRPSVAFPRHSLETCGHELSLQVLDLSKVSSRYFCHPPLLFLLENPFYFPKV